MLNINKMDNSFLAFEKNDFTKAWNNENLPISEIWKYGMVKMLPTETFAQITNVSSTIAFAGNLKVELVDCCNKVLQDITDLFFYKEITDIFGIGQIEYEFGNTGVDYWTVPVCLKLTHITSDDIWYSAPFFITEYMSHLTRRFEYGAEEYFDGISYDRTTVKLQSVRLDMYHSDDDEKTASKEYTQLDGFVSSYRNITTFIEKHKFQNCNRFTWKRLRCLFNHDIILVDGYRIHDKPTMKKGERKGLSNFFEIDIEWNKTEEFEPFTYQLFPTLSLAIKAPLGLYTLASIPNLITGTFTRNVTLGTGIFVIHDKTNNAIIHTFTEADITLVGNTFTINIAGMITINAEFYNTFTSGLFNSFGETIEINNDSDWAFKTVVGDWFKTDWNNADWLTN